MENRKTEIKKRKYGFMLAAALLLFAAAAYISWQVGSVYDCGVTPLDRCVQDWFFSLRSQWVNTLIIPLTHTSDTITIVVLCITSLRKKREDQPPQHLGLPYFREER